MAPLVVEYKQLRLSGNAVHVRTSDRYHEGRSLKRTIDLTLPQRGYGFPFLELAPELRNSIYPYCFPLGGIELFFDRFCDKLLKSKLPRSEKPPCFKRCNPTVLLINKQIYHEARGFLYASSLLFDHGSFNYKLCPEMPKALTIVSSHLIKHISTITITDDGHDFMADHMVHKSWLGFVNLLEQLSEVLGQDYCEHKLKRFTVSLKNRKLLTHFREDRCWNSEWRCGFRDGIRNAMQKFRKIHNVSNVTITGLPADFTLALTEKMMGPAVGFLNLNIKDRNRIYELALNPSDDINAALYRHTDMSGDMPQWSLAVPIVKRRTPSILLLNKQVTREALEVMHEKSLCIIACWDEMGAAVIDRLPKLSDYITPFTLRNVRHLEIYLDDPIWAQLMQEFFASFNAVVTETTFPDYDEWDSEWIPIRSPSLGTDSAYGSKSGSSASPIEDSVIDIYSGLSMEDAIPIESEDGDTDMEDVENYSRDPDASFKFSKFDSPSLYASLPALRTLKIHIAGSHTSAVKHLNDGTVHDLFGTHLMWARDLESVSISGSCFNEFWINDVSARMLSESGRVEDASDGPSGSDAEAAAFGKEYGTVLATEIDRIEQLEQSNEEAPGTENGQNFHALNQARINALRIMSDIAF